MFTGGRILQKFWICFNFESPDETTVANGRATVHDTTFYVCWFDLNTFFHIIRLFLVCIYGLDIFKPKQLNFRQLTYFGGKRFIYSKTFFQDVATDWLSIRHQFLLEAFLSVQSLLIQSPAEIAFVSESTRNVFSKSCFPPDPFCWVLFSA